MLMYKLGKKLELVNMEEMLPGERMVAVIDEAEYEDKLRKLGFDVDSDALAYNHNYTTAESRYGYITGVLCVPRNLDVLGRRHEIQCFINSDTIALVNRDGFAERMIERIIMKRVYHAETKETFIYNFISEIMSRDSNILDNYESRILEIEEDILDGKTDDFNHHMMPIRKELLTLNGYYDQLADFVKELKDNENRFFTGRKLKYLGNLMDKAERLENKTLQLLNYSQQVREIYQAEIDIEQNRTMQYLTVISTIFFPLTALTSWYGMNFTDMPELQHGYPFVIAAAIVMVIVVVWIFKKKKLL